MSVHALHALLFAVVLHPGTRGTLGAAADTTPTMTETRSALPDTGGVKDTVPVRRRKKVVAVEYSDWYSRRLTVHRWASYATVPLFIGNYVTGRQLYDYGNLAPDWAIRYHGPLATSVATLFAVNTVTGGWNLWDGRNDPSARSWRFAHAILMLTADAGFTTAGLLANSAERSQSRRDLHRTIALTSIGVSVVSYAMMLKPFRRDQ
jgi:uncharacterized membrane protein